MKKNLDHVDIPRLKKFVDSQNTASMVSPDDYVAEFLSNYKAWKDVVGCILGGDGRDENDGEWLYGNALIIYSSSLYGSSKNLTKGNVDLLKNELFDYEDKVRYMYEIKGWLYFNLVRCLHKLSLASDDELKKHLKDAMYYFISMGNNISYKVDCYAYRPASDYLIKSLENEQLSMSSPTTFNDPFDCPILEFLNLYGEDVYKLVSKALSECLKITCFVSNTELHLCPYEEGIQIHHCYPKHYNDPEEYLSELMWAHYAKNHSGVCIKYHFNNDITKFADEKKRQIAYFRDVKYTSDMDAYRKNNEINLHDAFFVKGKAWEYENELRLLAYDPNGTDKWWDKILRLFKRKRTGDYAYIDAKDCIAAVYFGLKCPKDKQDQIINILKGYKWVEKNIDGTKKIEHKVEFLRMEIDETQFGKAHAIKARTAK